MHRSPASGNTTCPTPPFYGPNAHSAKSNGQLNRRGCRLSQSTKKRFTLARRRRRGRPTIRCSRQTFVGFPCYGVEKLDLHFAERLGGMAACGGQLRVGLLPLGELGVPLPVRHADLVDELLEQFVLAILGGQDAAQQARL